MAIETYTKTLFHPRLTEAKVTLHILQEDKNQKNRIYIEGEPSPDNEEKREFTGLTSWSLIAGGREAETMEKILGIKDEHDEYLVLVFDNTHVEIFPNSRVVMFIR